LSRPGDHNTALYKCNQTQNDASIDHQNAINLFAETCKLSAQAAYERKAEIIAAYKPHNGMTQQHFSLLLKTIFSGLLGFPNSLGFLILRICGFEGEKDAKT
jgi:hypothetical protein